MLKLNFKKAGDDMKKLLLAISLALSPMAANAEWIISECSAYTLYECDGITASGEYAHEGGVACNFLPLGTIVTIGGKDYIVNDRCGIDNCIDIFMDSRERAIEFGRQYKEVYVNR